MTLKPPPIYLDHNATTPLDPRVIEAMEPYLNEQFGNPGSRHRYGYDAQRAVARARAEVASLLDCASAEVFFTSGATESNNLAIFGVVRAFRPAHIVTQATEHKAVLEVFEAAREFGAEVIVLPVDRCGRVSLEELKNALRPETVLVSIMLANNEVGTLQPIQAIAEICRGHGAIFHCDAAQGAGKIPLSLGKTPIDLLSISAHKLYGPKGIGALIVRPTNRDFILKPILFGGDQESGLRPGTLNVPGIVGLGAACAVAGDEMASEDARLFEYRARLWNPLVERFSARLKLNGAPLGEERLCNNLNFSLAGVDPDDLALGLSGIAFSAGSACNAASVSQSHVLKAMGCDPELSRTTVRFGLGRYTTAAEVDVVRDKLLKWLETRAPSRSAPPML